MARKRSGESSPEATVEVVEAATAEPTDGGLDAPASATTPPVGAGAELTASGATGGEPAAVAMGDVAGSSSADREAAAQAGDGATGTASGAKDTAAEKATEVKDAAAEKAQQVRETVTDKAQQVRATVTEKAQGAREQAQGAAGSAQAAPAKADDAFSQKPEFFVLGALAGGFVLAKLLGALGGDDE